MKTLLAFLLLSSSLLADSLCVRVMDTRQRCDQWGRCFIEKVPTTGTAVLLNKTQTGCWCAITARHVVAEAPAKDISIYIDGEWKPILNVYRLDANKEQVDAAFITFDHDNPKFEGVKVADEDVPVGESIRFSGYSGGRTFEEFTGKIKQTGSHGFATASTRPQHGQSGGGVYDRYGRLIGVVSGYTLDGNDDLSYVPVCHIRRHCMRKWGFFLGACVPVPHPLPPAYPQGPPPAPPVVVPDDPPPKPTEELPVAPAPDTLSKLTEQITEMRAMIAAIKPGERGPQGDPGPRGANGLMGMRGEPGPAGKDGAPGRDGTDADPQEVRSLKAELAALTAKIAALPKCNTTRLEARLTALEAAIAKLSDQPSPVLPSEGSQPGKIYYDVIDPQK